MKRILTYIYIAFLTIGFLIPLSHMNAQAAPPCTGYDANAGEYIPFGCNNADPASTNTGLQNQPRGIVGTTIDAGGKVAGWAAGTLAGTILKWISWTILKLCSLIMGMGGILLNYVLQKTIVEMSTGIEQIIGINIAWKMLKDLMNIVFIFLLLYQAIKVIIGLVDSSRVRTMVMWIAIGAILINFSLFFTKVIIDASNVFTIGIYNMTISSAANAAGANVGDATSITNTGLSSAIQQALGLQGFWSWNGLALHGTDDDYAPLVANIMASALFLVTAFVFFAVSALFVVRYIILIVLLALSPIAYMGIALPQLKGYANKWWDALLGQAIFAPLFMIMMWVVLTVISSAGFLSTNNWSDLQGIANPTNMSNSINMFFNFALVIGLTIAALIISKQYATQGGREISNFSNAATKFAGNALFGGSAMMLRGGVRLGQWTGKIEQDNDKLQAEAAKGGWRGARARANLAVNNGSFDMRRSRAGEKIASTLGVDAGRGIPFNQKFGEGGVSAARGQDKKEREAEMDAIVNSYSKNRDWDGLATYLKTGKPQLMSDTEWTARQQYAYKKLTERDRLLLDKSIADPAMSKELRTKLPIDEKIKIYATDKDWDGLVSNVYDEEKSDSKKAYIYEKLNARDRVAFEGALDKAGKSSDISKLRAGLSIEESDKTENEEKKVKKAEKALAAATVINNIAAGANNPATGAPYTHAEIEDAVRKMPDTAARHLSPQARIDANINVYLRSKQLNDLMSNGDPDLTPVEAATIRRSIEAKYPPTHEVVKWLNNPTRSADWS